MNAERGGLPVQQQADVSFALEVFVGEILRPVRPFAVMQPVKNVKYVSCLDIFLLRDGT
jgi:hypothetical protein